MTSLRFAVIYLLALAVFAVSPASWAAGKTATQNPQPQIVRNAGASI